MTGLHAPITGCIYSTRNDACYPREATVHYPLRPLYGRGVSPICRRLGSGSSEQFELGVGQDGQVVPAWMTDEQLCAGMMMSFDPHCSVAALLELLSLIQSTGL
ncbi:MAG: hypothetical protein ACOY3P_02290 [Planctomycetota bacterium]